MLDWLRRSLSRGNASVRCSCQAFSQSLMNGGWWTQPMVSCAIRGLASPGSIKKQAEPAATVGVVRSWVAAKSQDPTAVAVRVGVHGSSYH